MRDAGFPVAVCVPAAPDTVNVTFPVPLPVTVRVTGDGQETDALMVSDVLIGGWVVVGWVVGG